MDLFQIEHTLTCFAWVERNRKLAANGDCNRRGRTSPIPQYEADAALTPPE